MFKKIRKLLQEDLTQRYQNFEERYLRFETKVYKTLEDRLASLEERFYDLADVLSGNKSTKETATKERPARNKKEATAETETPKEPKAKRGPKPKAEAPEQEQKTAEVAPKAKRGPKPKATQESVAKPELSPLTKLPRLGAVMVAKLKEAGITSLEQIAEMTDEQATEMEAKVKGFEGAFTRNNWREAAKNLMVS